METRTLLQHGSAMPMVGFGTYYLTSEQCESAVKIALDNGYRHIDTAEFYANHEGIAKAIKASGLSRDDIFITDKLAAGFTQFNNEKSYEQTLESLDMDLQKLEMDYVDLYLIHAPGAQNQRVNQYRALLELQKQGKCKEIGVSNYSIAHLKELDAAGLPPPAVNQIELHPLCTQTELVAYCANQGIVCVAYSSLAPASTWRTAEDQSSLKDDKLTAHLPLLQELCTKYNTDEAKILLKWALQNGYPILPKSIKPERIISNADLFQFEMSEEDVLRLDACDVNAAVAWPMGNPLTWP